MKALIEFLRRFKWSYILYNLFQYDKLKHNLPKYRQWGLSKQYFSPISSKDFFKNGQVEMPHSIMPLANEIEKTKLYAQLDQDSQDSLIKYRANGYAILNSFVPAEICDRINNQIEAGLHSGKFKFKYGNKIMFALHQLEELRRLGRHSQLQELLDTLIGGKAQVFQSINFIHGSEQKSHSDSIHMTTYPLGGLLGVWVALEDIGPKQGPLHYYPGSHQLPYYLNRDYDNEGNYWMIGNKTYAEYEAMLERRIEEMGLQKKIFTAKKGDVLIWHANLLHGGEPHIDKSKTRKSVVFHYFDENCICYHEISQRPALINIQ